MLDFLGVTAIDALNGMPQIKAEYYEHVIRQGDELYYKRLPPSKLPLAIAKKHEIEACMLISSHLNDIDPDYLRVIMHAETGWPGAKIPTPANNSFDLGIIQVNQRVWDIEFKREGLNLPWSVVQNHTCANLYIGGRILKGRLKHASDAMTGIANYHRYRTKDNTHNHDNYKKRATTIYSAILEDYTSWLNNQQTILETTYKGQPIAE